MTRILRGKIVRRDGRREIVETPEQLEAMCFDFDYPQDYRRRNEPIPESVAKWLRS